MSPPYCRRRDGFLTAHSYSPAQSEQHCQLIGSLWRDRTSYFSVLLLVPVLFDHVEVLSGYPPFEEQEEQTVDDEDDRKDDTCHRAYVQCSTGPVSENWLGTAE